MEEFKETSVWELLKLMQRKVKNNAATILNNSKSIEIVKKNYSPSAKRNKIIDSIYKKNDELAIENSTLLGLHNSLFKFYNEFKGLLNVTPELKIEMQSDSGESWEKYRESCMKKSISGDLKINYDHPFINDQDFFTELMTKCQSMEMYERCSEIKKIKSKNEIHN